MSGRGSVERSSIYIERPIYCLIDTGHAASHRGLSWKRDASPIGSLNRSRMLWDIDPYDWSVRLQRQSTSETACQRCPARSR